MVAYLATNRATGTDLSKPAMSINTNITRHRIGRQHDRIISTEQLLSAYCMARISTSHPLLDTYIYIVPRVNPDGADLALSDNTVIFVGVACIHGKN